MTDRPILFSAPMVRAILDGRKTVTRRVLKPQPNCLNGGLPLNNGRGCYSTDAGWKRYVISKGDRLWVRETFSGKRDYDEEKWPPSAWFRTDQLWYWADGNPAAGDWTRPKPGIHMPRWASRLTLTVTDVTVERLQDITEEQARAEGVLIWAQWLYAHARDAEEIDRLTAASGEAPGSIRTGFACLWNSINGSGAWDANPWVAAYSFTVARGNIDAVAA